MRNKCGASSFFIMSRFSHMATPADTNALFNNQGGVVVSLEEVTTS
jgi:hypothetical protein